MDRNEYTDLAYLVFSGLLVRLLIYDEVAVNGDSGLYLYDAKRILWGHQPFVQYPTRSPVMEYLLAGAVAISENPLVGARGLMIVIGLAAGIAVYFLGREVAGHRVGLAAGMLYLLTPFQAVWGLWIKTEPTSALFVVIALVVLYRVVDRRHIPLWAGTAIGISLGVAFLVRRSVLVPIGVMMLWTLWYRQRNRDEWLRFTLPAAGAAMAGGLTTLGLVYLYLGRFDPTVGFKIGYHHLFALFLSDGMGSLGYVPLQQFSPETATEASAPWFYQFCQKCGKNTIQVFTRTMIVILPVLFGLLIWFRAWVNEGFHEDLQAVVPTMLLVYAGLGLLYAGSFFKFWPVITFGAVIVFVWWLNIPDWDDLWQPRLSLLFAIPLMLMIAYLYRDRILYNTYFQDFYPYVAVLSGLALTELWDQRQSIQPAFRAVGIGLFAVTIIVSSVFAYPYVGDAIHEQDTYWMTMDRVEFYGQDMDARLDDGDRVFTAQPLYVINSDTRLVGHLSRQYYLFQAWYTTPVADRLEQEILDDLGTEQVPYVIVGMEAQTVMDRSPAINETIHEEYCPIENEMYNATNATLMRRC